MGKDNGVFKGQTQAEISNLKDDIRDVKNDIRNLSGKVDSVEAQIIAIDKRLSTFETKDYSTAIVINVVIGIIVVIATKMFIK